MDFRCQKWAKPVRQTRAVLFEISHKRIRFQGWLCFMVPLVQSSQHRARERGVLQFLDV